MEDVLGLYYVKFNNVHVSRDLQSRAWSGLKSQVGLY